MAIAVIGAGAWGTALACQAARREHSVRIWALEPEVALDIDSRHMNSAYLADASLPDGIRASSEIGEVATGAEIVILVPPSKHLRSVSTRLAPYLAPDATVVVATKGIEESTLQLMSEVLAETLPDVADERMAFLSGPSFAREVVAGRPTNVTLASRDAVAARRVQPLLHSPTFRIYTSRDPIGVQVGGAVKNVAAVATGACDGLGLGPNAVAALMTRALAEITRLGVALGASPITFLGLAGMGDLILTCSGDLSRNRTLGKKLAEGIDPGTYLGSQRSVAEGFFTSAAVYDLSQKLGVDMPIAEQVFHVLHRRRPLAEAMQLLINRDSGDEFLGISDVSSPRRPTG